MSVNDLGINPSAPTADWDDYAEASSGFELPDEGEYTFKAKTPILLKKEADGGDVKPTADGSNAGVRIDPVFLDGAAKGKQLKFQRVWTNVYKSGKRAGKASSAGDFLKATGYNGKPGNVGQTVEAVVSSQGKEFKARMAWNADHQVCGFKLSGQNNFPIDDKGKRLQKVKCGCPGATPNYVYAQANLFFVPKAKG